MSLIGATNEEKIWNFLYSKIKNPYGVSGIMGNLMAESGLNSKNLENIGNTKLCMTDDEYVAAIDSGIYTKEQFVNDRYGFGIYQITYWSRKQALYDYVKSKNKSIGDLETQLEFLCKELGENYKSVLTTLKTATSVKEASNAVLLKFECPADQSTSVQNKRAAYGQNYYNKYANEGSVTMGCKTYTKGVAVKLSSNFKSTEFDCHGSSCCSKTLIDEKLVEYLQKIREHFGKAITISSGYRCATHNKSVGGATASYHTKGQAADIVMNGVTPAEVAKYAESIGILGIGLYSNFVHIDTRTTKSFWYGHGQAYRSTFGGTTSGSNSATSSTTLSKGSNGSAVKDLQTKLIALGYSCGSYGADGDYGAATVAAVRSFQSKNGLTVDGIAGPNTLAAIEKAYSNSISNQVKVTANVLNVRTGAGTNYAIKTTVKKGAIYEVTEEKDGWGKISSGWISLKYTEKV